MMEKIKAIEEETAKLAGLQVDLLQKIRAGKITLAQFENFVNSPANMQGAQKLPPSWKVLEFTIVPSEQTDMPGLVADWKKAGKSDDGTYINSNITDANFPTNKDNLPQTNRKIVLINFRKSMTTEQAIVEGAKYGFKQPTIQEGILFDTQHPDAQREKWIVVPHKPWQDSNGDLNVLSLKGGYDARGLFFNWYSYSYEWSGAAWFLFASD